MVVRQRLRHDGPLWRRRECMHLALRHALNTTTANEALMHAVVSGSSSGFRAGQTCWDGCPQCGRGREHGDFARPRGPYWPVILPDATERHSNYPNFRRFLWGMEDPMLLHFVAISLIAFCVGARAAPPGRPRHSALNWARARSRSRTRLPTVTEPAASSYRFIVNCQASVPNTSPDWPSIRDSFSTISAHRASVHTVPGRANH
jgi:hypothetical protein